MSQWQPSSAFANAVHVAGFDYDPAQDIIYSRMDALQRSFGYAYGYDKAALLMSAAIDCEPIFFDYGGKTWMIELWKGQYILETGCEIGVYNRDVNDNSPLNVMLDKILGSRDYDSNPTHNLFFDCANDSEMLLMNFTLYRNGVPLFTRGPEKHWWLTGFKWGVYSEPEQLSMSITITFDQSGMQNAFVNALHGMGYQNVQVTNNQVSFTFDHPKTYQPRLNDPLLSKVNADNQSIVGTYAAFHLPSNDPNNTPDNVINAIEASVLQNFFGQTLNREISDLSQWLSVISGLFNFKVMDFSCTVELDNQSNEQTLVSSGYGVDKGFDGDDLGKYVVLPPQIILPKTKGRLLIQDNFGIHGGEGWAIYDLVDKSGNRQTFKFSFGCPTGFDYNHVNVEPANAKIYFYAKSGDGDWGGQNQVPGGGHPLQVRFVIGD